MLFLAVPGPGGVWRIIRGPASGPVASTAVSPATAPGLTGRPRAFPQKSARAAGSAQSMVRAAKLRLTVVMIASFRWVHPRLTYGHGTGHAEEISAPRSAVAAVLRTGAPPRRGPPGMVAARARRSTDL